MIVSSLSSDSSESVIYLSLTCVYFFRLLGPAVQSILAEDTVPWAGDRLIFVGDYAVGLDLAGICTTEELREFDEEKEKYGDNPLFRISKGTVMCAKNEIVGRLQSPASLCGRVLRRAGSLERSVTETLTFDDLELFQRFDAIAKTPQLSADDHWKHVPVLRNLTAREYVRDDAIAKSDYAYSLGEVVAVFTNWTKYAVGIEDLECCGPWAGHRFDIATRADILEKGWTDVSELAIERLRNGTGREKKTGRRV